MKRTRSGLAVNSSGSSSGMGNNFAGDDRRDHKIPRRCRRDGAMRWNVYHDVEHPGRWVEVFVVESWLEHLRQHERMTVTDRDLSYRARAFHVGKEEPIIRHLIAGLPIG